MPCIHVLVHLAICFHTEQRVCLCVFIAHKTDSFSVICFHHSVHLSLTEIMAFRFEKCTDSVWKKQSIFRKASCSAGPWITCRGRYDRNKKKVQKLCRSLRFSFSCHLIAFRFNFKVEKHLFDMGFVARQFRTCKTSVFVWVLFCV